MESYMTRNFMTLFSSFSRLWFLGHVIHETMVSVSISPFHVVIRSASQSRGQIYPRRIIREESNPVAARWIVAGGVSPTVTSACVDLSLRRTRSR
jgi:hypothetical protein